MKMMKRIIAMVLVSVMALSFTACHEKNELAVTVGDFEFTSAYYMCALINADMDAQSKVYDKLTDKEKQGKVDYYSHKIDGKEYVKWVEDEAIKTLKNIATYKTLCAENNVKPTQDQINQSNMYAEYYWNNYGYGSFFEPNGVSKQTFLQYMLDSSHFSLYFEHLYGKEGTKKISKDEMDKTIRENYLLADSISTNYKDKDGKPLKDDEIKKLKEKFNGYVAALKDGSKTFEAIYHEVSGTKESDDTKDENKDDKNDKNEKPEKPEVKPVNRHASVLGAEDTGFEHDDFKTLKKMAADEIKLVELEKEGGLKILIKRDIFKDPYYLEQIDSSVRHFIKDDEFEKLIEEKAKTMKPEIVKRAVKQFKVKKIVYPQTQY